MPANTEPTNTETKLDPHHHFVAETNREKFLLELLNALWARYRDRVGYVRDYETLVANAGGKFENDHIAFRTIACQEPYLGIGSISRLFTVLGYQLAGCYTFPDKFLSAVHLQHPKPGVPKLFISQIETWRLSESVRRAILKAVRQAKGPISDRKLSRLANIDEQSEDDMASLLHSLVRYFHKLPWPAPKYADIEIINAGSQYAAWTLLHGNNVNHYTALVNSHGVESLDSIEKTVQALRDAGVPMKEGIEGEPGSKLRQTATQAVELPVSVREKGHKASVDWTYAYFEIAQRGDWTDPFTGQQARFEGFLGPQATQLFDMTKKD